MIVLTSYTSGTYKAQIRSSVEKGFKQLYTASCTMSEEHAAKAVVEKNFGALAAAKIQQVKDGEEILALVGDFFKDPKRKQVFNVWTFDMRARTPQPAPASDEPPAPEWIGNPAAKAIDGKAELIPAVDLPAVASAIQKLEDGIQEIDRRAKIEQLPYKVKQGFHAYRAHLHFAVKDHKERGGRKSSSRREELSFGGWLAESAPFLAEATAYKYMSAFRGLGLPEDCTEADVDAAIAAFTTPPSLAGLIAAATERLAPPSEPPAPPHQLTFDDYVATLKQLREDADLAIEQSKDMPEPLRKQLVARFYASLHALTGTHWQPSDDPHELGTIDPDTIAL